MLVQLQGGNKKLQAEYEEMSKRVDPVQRHTHFEWTTACTRLANTLEGPPVPPHPPGTFEEGTEDVPLKLALGGEGSLGLRRGKSKAEVELELQKELKKTLKAMKPLKKKVAALRKKK